MAHEVFISHSSNDRSVALSICAALENAGMACWMAPRNVQPGRPFAGEITRGIQQSKVMVLIFSGHSNSSEQVVREVQLAVDCHLHIIQFRIADVKLNDDLRYYLSTPHWLDALTPPLENHLQLLETSIKALLAAPAEVAEARARSDVAPLLQAERRQAGIKEEQEAEAATPMQLWLNFPHAMIAGYGSIIEARLENSARVALQHVDLMLESKGLLESVQTVCHQIIEGGSAYLRLELMPARAGNFVLRCNLKGRKEDQTFALRGTIPITINIAPETTTAALDISDIQYVRGAGTGGGLGQEFGSVNISTVLTEGSIRTLNQLLSATFPQSYGRVPLELDYEVSQTSIVEPAVDATTSWTIPEKFLTHVQSGTKLRLEPRDESEQLRAIHLVARPQFKLGRNRESADFLTWFWPRSEENDDRTKRLSKEHAIAEICGEKLILRDLRSANRSTFEGHPLSVEENDVIDQRGTLILGHEYHLDVTPFETALKTPLRIANERLWKGPPAGPVGAIRGCVRFTPVNSEIAQYHALWLFTDANFGCSNLNPLVLDWPGLAEVEGCFHYYRQNFWIESLPGGTVIAVDDHKLGEREIVPLANDSVVMIGTAVVRVTVEP